MATICELRDREIVLRSLREGIDTSNAAGRMVAGVLASLAELELELGRERRAAAREARRARGQSIGRPNARDAKQAVLAQRMHASGESASTIANILGVSRATVYRVLAEQTLKAIERMLGRSRVGYATRATQLGCLSSVRAWSIWS